VLLSSRRELAPRYQRGLKSLPHERKALAERYTIDAEEALRREQVAAEEAARQKAAAEVAAREAARRRAAEAAALRAAAESARWAAE
jgi:membrane protein involved in colicin uptake